MYRIRQVRDSLPRSFRNPFSSERLFAKNRYLDKNPVSDKGRDRAFGGQRNRVSAQRLLAEIRYLKKPGFSMRPYRAFGGQRNRVSGERLLVKTRYL
jgi:hypothetical protein